MKAFCYASGLIEFGRRVPKGALPIAEGPSKPLRDFINGVARHGYKTKKVKGRPTKIPGTDVLLVPGVPEAPDQGKAYAAWVSWRNWINRQAPKNVMVGD